LALAGFPLKLQRIGMSKKILVIEDDDADTARFVEYTFEQEG